MLPRKIDSESRFGIDPTPLRLHMPGSTIQKTGTATAQNTETATASGIAAAIATLQNPANRTQKCGLPECARGVYPNPRYHNSVCSDCQHESPPVDDQGNPMDFFNVDASGGFISVTTINGEEVRGVNHVCYIKGVECHANEARFGGIVITPAR